MQNNLKKATIHGLQYIASAQDQTGGFVSYINSTQDHFTFRETVHTTFSSSLILGALSSVHHPTANDVSKKIAAHLLSERKTQWSFNYWTKQEMEKHDFVYPDDLDDTFVALTGLYLHDPTLISPEALAALTKLLLATEIAVGGPYRTWLVPSDSTPEWLDVDGVVNANITYFLSLIGAIPPNLTRLLEESVWNKNFSSPYYPSLYQVAYFIGRNTLSASTAKELLDFLLKACADASLSATEHALITSTLIRLGAKPETYALHINALLQLQHPDGSWDAGALYVSHHTETQTYYIGSPAMSTAFALEACALYQAIQALPPSQKPAENTPTSHNTKTVSRVIADTSSMHEPLRSTFQHYVQKVLASSNGPEIIRIADSFNESLKQPLQHQKPLLGTLSSANLYGWSAYTIYDDFLDDEGDPKLLSVANSALRMSYEAFLYILPKNKAYQQFVRDTFTTIDAANEWEILNGRLSVHKKRTITIENLPDYEDLAPLAHRSIGHALGPLAVVAQKGFSPQTPEFQAVHKAIHHYIIAKQLNDDAHDWREDLIHGHATYVVTVLLKELALEPGTYKLGQLLPLMQKHFWHNTLITISTEMKRQTHLSRQFLAQTKILKTANPISLLLDEIDTSVEDTLTKQSQTKEFLQFF